MKLTNLLIAVVTATSTVSAECYKGGSELREQADKNRARELIDYYCEHAHGVYKSDGVWKYCYNMGYMPFSSRGYLLLEFDRTGGGSQDLSKSACKAYLGEIVSECRYGGRKYSADNWSYRVDPGTTCDGKKPKLEMSEGIRI